MNIQIDIVKGYIMIDSKQVKKILFGLGADLCGIASIDRFNDAPKGYHPTDVLPTCKSVISFGCRFPIGTLICNSPVPYTRVRNSLLITPEFGSMIWLGAVLCEQELECDELKDNICNNCNACVTICPVNALEHLELEQQACWDYAFGDDKTIQSWVINCHKCRDICPYNLGTENSFIKK